METSLPSQTFSELLGKVFLALTDPALVHPPTPELLCQLLDTFTLLLTESLPPHHQRDFLAYIAANYKVWWKRIEYEQTGVSLAPAFVFVKLLTALRAVEAIAGTLLLLIEAQSTTHTSWVTSLVVSRLVRSLAVILSSNETKKANDAGGSGNTWSNPAVQKVLQFLADGNSLILNVLLSQISSAQIRLFIRRSCALPAIDLTSTYYSTLTEGLRLRRTTALTQHQHLLLLTSLPFPRERSPGGVYYSLYAAHLKLKLHSRWRSVVHAAETYLKTLHEHVLSKEESARFFTLVMMPMSKSVASDNHMYSRPLSRKLKRWIQSLSLPSVPIVGAESNIARTT